MLVCSLHSPGVHSSRFEVHGKISAKCTAAPDTCLAAVDRIFASPCSLLTYACAQIDETMSLPIWLCGWRLASARVASARPPAHVARVARTSADVTTTRRLGSRLAWRVWGGRNHQPSSKIFFGFDSTLILSGSGGVLRSDVGDGDPPARRRAGGRCRRRRTRPCELCAMLSPPLSGRLGKRGEREARPRRLRATARRGVNV